MDGFKHERTLQKKTQVPECPSEPIDDKPTTNSLVKRRKRRKNWVLVAYKKCLSSNGVFVCKEICSGNTEPIKRPTIGTAFTQKIQTHFQKPFSTKHKHTNAHTLSLFLSPWSTFYFPL